MNKKHTNTKPFIAIPARFIDADHINHIAVPKSYFDAISSAGGIPVLIYDETNADEDYIASSFDGLLIPGGEDINSKCYHEELRSTIVPIDSRIDELDLRLILAFAKLKKPILGICRGMQCINIAFHGSLFQDVNTEVHTEYQVEHNQRTIEQKNYVNLVSHEIVCKENTILHHHFGNQHVVNSYHHQCINQLADGFTASAYSIPDGIIEGIENYNIIGVQWHPEWLLSDKSNLALFKEFIHNALQCK